MPEIRIAHPTRPFGAFYEDLLTSGGCGGEFRREGECDAAFALLRLAAIHPSVARQPMLATLPGIPARSR
ncbi:hypothetical protein PPH41_09760 [Burkholderia gladioli]|uniref:Uncharacterized protein n=1 Tax=Burkholderia gladioli TaxID=28095 RepID=A0A2A7SDZ0_BURGA|nr:hypothetical protein [Burkholderia gladioli]ATF89847.1 hypothetical protein CO712_33770 [Burkholderia gladioli pv. gladioli]MDC6128252.1 hypothetical protein [Burkholderia gladioli]PEH41776.1 hypothetical protein CRM94_06195 [Burkholderia gladioli]